MFVVVCYEWLSILQGQVTVKVSSTTAASSSYTFDLTAVNVGTNFYNAYPVRFPESADNVTR